MNITQIKSTMLREPSKVNLNRFQLPLGKMALKYDTVRILVK